EGHLAPGADHELGRAAADVEHERRRLFVRVALAHRPEKRQLRLLVAGEDVRLQAVALLHLLGELLPVRRVAHRAGEDRERGAGADRRSSWCDIGRPGGPASGLSDVRSGIRSRVVGVAEPIWGVTIRFGAQSGGSSAGSGSGSVTSSAAAAISLSWSAFGGAC